MGMPKGLRSTGIYAWGLPSDWGCNGGWGMTGRVFGWLGNKNGMGFAPGGDRGRGFGPKRRRDITPPYLCLKNLRFLRYANATGKVPIFPPQTVSKPVSKIKISKRSWRDG